MEATTVETTLRYLKVMAHESRLRLLGILADGEWSVTELAELLDVREPTVSHHLAKMLEVDLVRMRPLGNAHLYSLNNETLQRLNKDLLSAEKVAAIAQDTATDAWEQKVLRSFFDGDRLTKIPDMQKKRQVILKWLVKQFEPGVRYTENEVNTILKRHHEDSATLRREFIANKLMQRENGVYWRIDHEA